MSFRDLLNLKTVQIGRITQAPDGMGGTSVSTSLTTLSRAAIWQAGSSTALLSDKLAASSSHVLVFEPSEYTMVTKDDRVVYGSETYRVNGRADDVMHKGDIMVVGMELIE